MTTEDMPPTSGDGAGEEAGSAASPDAEEIVEAEVVDDDPTGAADEMVEVEAAEIDPFEAALAERDEYLDSLRRVQAEFENYKKREMKKQADQAVRAAASLVNKLLPVLDALDLATDHVGDNESDEARALVAASGLLQGILAKEGLERIYPVGQEFDPNAHEAVGQLPVPEDAEPTESGEPLVAQVMRAGYRWHGTVVRPAMVMVQG